MSAKSTLILILSLFLMSCDQGENEARKADDDAYNGYTYFTVGQMRVAAGLRQQALAGSGAYAILEDLVATAPKRLPGSEGDGAAVAWAACCTRGRPP